MVGVDARVFSKRRERLGRGSQRRVVVVRRCRVSFFCVPDRIRSVADAPEKDPSIRIDPDEGEDDKLVMIAHAPRMSHAAFAAWSHAGSLDCAGKISVARRETLRAVLLPFQRRFSSRTRAK